MRIPSGVRGGGRSWQRTAGSVLIVLGSVALLSAGTSAARGAIARDDARARWAELDAKRAAAGGRRVATASQRDAIARGTPVARLVARRIGLDEIVVEGVGDDELRAGPGHMTGSALPGESGNAVISAHRDRHFSSLGRLVVGDTILTESDAGDVAWTVTRIRVVDADARVLRATKTRALTLTTCWPIRYFGSAPDRLIVEALPVS